MTLTFRSVFIAVCDKGCQRMPLILPSKSGSGICMEDKQETGALAVPDDRIESRIYLIRGKKVMLDRDLAELYGVEVKVLNQAVRRNAERFPEDFMFKIALHQAPNLKSQIVTSSSRSQIVTLNNEHGGRRKAISVFTESGIAMLSSVLKSSRAIAVNVQIMRTFTRLRELVISNAEFRRRLDALEGKYDQQFSVVFKAIQRLLDDGATSTDIGFRTDV